jgi:hypothetical protein
MGGEHFGESAVLAQYIRLQSGEDAEGLCCLVYAHTTATSGLARV